jgi:maleate cis-trans isomerase
MTTQARAKIGFIQAGASGSDRGSPRHLQNLVPDDVQAEHVGMEFVMDFRIGSSYEANIPLIGKKEEYLRRAPELVKERGWQAVTVMGAPVELLNPGLLKDLQAILTVPVTTAASASSTALRAMGARRALVMTPWDDSVNSLLGSYLADTGVEAVFPSSMPFSSIAEALAMPPEDVFSFTKRAFEEAGNAQAIYFQAPLDYFPVLAKIEEELHTSVVASTTAPLWLMLSRLGLSYEIHGGGRLLHDWPSLPDA